MAVAPAPSGALDPSDTSPERPTPLAVGVVVWLASELMFFAGLFAAYYTLRAENEVWPPEGVELDVPRAFASTVLLLASSGTMHLSVVRAEHGDRRGALRWLAVTFVLGTAFLVNLGLEWAGNDFSISSNASLWLAHCSEISDLVRWARSSLRSSAISTLPWARSHTQASRAR